VPLSKANLPIEELVKDIMKIFLLSASPLVKEIERKKVVKKTSNNSNFVGSYGGFMQWLPLNWESEQLLSICFINTSEIFLKSVELKIFDKIGSTMCKITFLANSNLNDEKVYYDKNFKAKKINAFIEVVGSEKNKIFLFDKITVGDLCLEVASKTTKYTVPTDFMIEPVLINIVYKTIKIEVWEKGLGTIRVIVIKSGMEQEQIKNVFNSETIKIKRILILLDCSQKNSLGTLTVKCPKMFFAKFFEHIRVLKEEINENDSKS